MKKYTAILIFSMAVCGHALSQNNNASSGDSSNAQNGWYFEAAGQSLVGITFNYERYFSKKPGGLSVHIGFGGGYIPGIFDDGITVFGALPAGLSYNIPVSANKQHFIEIGAGYSLLFGADGSGAGSIGSVIAGYRYVSPSGKLQLRATLMPAVFLIGSDGGGPIPWVGFSIGRRF